MNNNLIRISKITYLLYVQNSLSTIKVFTPVLQCPNNFRVITQRLHDISEKRDILKCKKQVPVIN